LAAVAVGTGVVAWLRGTRPAYAPYAAGAVTLGGTVTALATLPWDEPTGLYAALATLLATGAAGLVPADRRIILAAATGPGMIAAVCVLPGTAVALFAPYEWLTAGWGPPPGSSVDGLAPGGVRWPGDGWDPVVLALLVLAASLGVAGLGRRQWAWPVVAPCAALALLVAPAAWNTPWPAGPGTAVAVAAFAGLCAARLRAGTVVQAVLCALAAGAGLGGSLATVGTTYAALGAAAAIGVAAALLGRRTAARVIGWLVTGAGAASLVIALAVDSGLPAGRTAVGMVAVAGLLLVAVASLPGDQRAEIWTVEALSYSAAGAAVLLAAAAGPRPTAVILVGYGAMLGLSALRPGRRGLAPAAAGCELLAWWLLLYAAEVGAVEAYTLPVALLALAGGALNLRRRPYQRSWLAYGPALAATFLPSLALLLGGAADPARRLLLGLGALVVLVLGAGHRRQAPVVAGAGVLGVLAAYELVRFWDMLPRWLPMGAAGLILVMLGATYERRRRDLRRVRDAVTQMR
jgi:hypothetical protein